MWSQHIVSLYITDTCLPEVPCFLEVDMNYWQTRLCELKKSLRAPVFGFFLDNTHIHSSFYNVYSQPDISDVSSSRKRSLRLVETAEIQVILQSSFFPPGWGCDLIWASTVTLLFFPTLYFEPKPDLFKTLEGLLMRLVIFVNTIFQLKSLNITVSVCYVSGSKVNKKERSRLSLFLCFCVPPC